MSEDTTALPVQLQEIVEDFTSTPPSERLQLLLEFSEELPELPERYRDHPELMEPVPECQSPVFVVTELRDGHVHPYISAPAEAPTTRGFGSVLAQGLDGLSADEVRSIPGDFAFSLGLTQLISPLRLHGMTGLLARIKAQVDRLAG
ncbi:SufE family protein [Sediminivirga luteola]|uniref:Cysteine desufuration protein SufE n=1 Tax=Sediminivirga luteola TaxID=1774748 RepID=A0A8J2TZA0_9MICO|nr:SufE family protein [Sediminivirga luteola]MCI2264977.1 SufE family protein [Sediminivirga luteola]GGA19502.1 cysteine desufuration protein SufE [Sediminivirga luteola]